MARFNNKYEDIYGNMVELTADELSWFYSIVENFKKLPEADGIEITNRNHDEFNDKSKESLGVFYTNYPNDIHAKSLITIDNYFIHEQFDCVFNGGYNLSFETLESTISHEIAHRFQFRHCKRHARLTAEILEKYNEIIGKAA